eukprot:m.191511 g.191511  ORF g.191511 m.191511 type:complete len:86 (+) comp24925_c0_seq1:326-583(+)
MHRAHLKKEVERLLNLAAANGRGESKVVTASGTVAVVCNGKGVDRVSPLRRRRKCWGQSDDSVSLLGAAAYLRCRRAQAPPDGPT